MSGAPRRITKGEALVGDLTASGTVTAATLRVTDVEIGGGVMAEGGLTATAGLQIGGSGSVLMQVAFGTVTVDAGSVGAGAVLAVSVTMASVGAGDMVVLFPPTTLEAGLVVQGAVVGAAGSATVRIYNSTAAPIDPASATWTYLHLK